MEHPMAVCAYWGEVLRRCLGQLSGFQLTQRSAMVSFDEACAEFPVVFAKTESARLAPQQRI
jgi:hypothetical protein